ncbi:MAG: helicase-related protein, partial [Natronospirillum sp.]
IGSLENGAHIVVGTPARIEEHLRKGKLSLDDLHTLVLDEADRMLDMGFQPTLDAILALAPPKRQTLLFSATFPEQIEQMADRVLKSPVLAQVEESLDNVNIDQRFYRVRDDRERLMAVRLLLHDLQPESALVFCNTKQGTADVADALREQGFSAVALNGNLEQKQRDQVLVRFTNKSVSVLVATDVAARGLDIDTLDLVINYQMALDAEVHVHRVGRTGRAGERGIACTLFNEREGRKVDELQGYLGVTFPPQALPDAQVLNAPPPRPPMATLQIDGGRKQKMRAGDILGALTNEQGISGQDVGKIQIFEMSAYVAVKRESANAALSALSQGKVKGKAVRVRRL